MTRTSHRLHLAALGLTAALALTGCGDGVGQRGAAATVGDQRVTTSQLDDLVTRSLADAEAKQTVGADPVAFERAALRRIISHLIITAAAARENVTVTGAAVDATFERFAQQTGGIDGLKAAAKKQGVAEPDLREALTDVTLRDALGDKLTASITVPEAQLKQAYAANIAQYDTVRSSHILVATLARAKQLLAAVKATPSRFPDLAKQFSTDTGSKDKGGDLGYQGKGALEKNFETAIFTNPPGSFVIAKTQFGFHVIQVVDRRTVTFAQAQPELRRNLLSQQRMTAVDGLILKVSKDLGVEVNPRFGTWDVTTQQVIASPVCPGAVTSPSPRPGDAAPDPSAPPTAAPVCP